MSRGDFHDGLFRKTFGRAEVARAHFEAHLPAAVAAEIDWDSLELRPESYVSAELLQTQSDVLYRARLRTGEELFLYVLLEHQRARDYAMALRLLVYMVRIWERWMRDNGAPTQERPLPFIVPMVLYNGLRRWPVSARFQDLLPRSSLRDHVLAYTPDFVYQILDLNQTPDEAFRGQALREMTLLLKWGQQERFWEHFPTWLETFRTIYDSDGSKSDVVTAILRYITSIVRTAPPPEVITLLRERVSPETGDLIMTWAEQLRREGIEQGIERGIERGIEQGVAMEREAALARQRRQLRRLLSLKFGTLPEVLGAQVEDADMATLERWTERLLLAGSLDAVFGEE